MDIVTLQRRLTEVGRIRLGAKKTTANGKTYPARLDKFRLTSRDKPRLDAAATLYGGTVEPWESGWELFTETDILPVAVVPGQALNQSFELWGQKQLPGGKKTGVICLRRCDGETEALTGEPCICSADDNLQCKPTTRLSVVLTEVPGIGVWRVEAHGWNAASELAGTVQLLEALVATGRPVRARLRLDSREQTTETEKRQFVVPVIDIDHTLGQVLDSLGAPPAQTWQPIAPPPPVAELDAGQGDAIRQAGTDGPKRRKNSPPELPATGLNPRGAPEPPAADVLSQEQMNHLRALYTKVGITERSAQKITTAALLGLDKIETHSTLTPNQARRVINALSAVELGVAEFVCDDLGTVTGIRDTHLDDEGEPAITSALFDREEDQ